MEAQFNSLHFENQEKGERQKIQEAFEANKLQNGYLGWMGDLGIIDK